MQKLFFVILVLFLGVHLANCAQQCKETKDAFDREYKGKDDSYWKFGTQYDYNGITTNQPHLSQTSDMTILSGKINEQINKELYAHYIYMSIAFHFSRDDIFLPGFQKFFKKAAAEESEHAQMFMEYQNKRGGQIKLQSIPTPYRQQWGSGLMAMKHALCLEKQVLQSLKEVHLAAEKEGDVQMMDFIEGNFLNEQIESIKRLADYVNILKRVGGGLGEYQVDNDLLK